MMVVHYVVWCMYGWMVLTYKIHDASIIIHQNQYQRVMDVDVEW